MSSAALVLQNNFAQTGTVDWVHFADGLVSFTWKGLARCANYGVDPFTIVLGRTIAQQFPLGRKGEKRVADAINALSFHASFDKVLFFGFGLQSIPRLLSSHNEGLALTAISAALSEVYSEDVAATVLNELLLLLVHDRESTPSLQSWLKLVKACAGTLAKTNFGKLAEDYMRLNRTQSSLHPFTGVTDFDDLWRSRSHSKDIAKAWISLGQISRGEVEAVTITGGGDIGVLAAVADWLFDLNIIILDHLDNVVFRSSNCGPGSVVHARFIMEDRTQIDSSRSKALQYTSKVVHLNDISDILHATDNNNDMVVSGRLDWNDCLISAFGSAFERLRNLTSTFGSALGYAASIFESVANGESNIDLETRKNWIYYSTAGYGNGYLRELERWFPELKESVTRAQTYVAIHYEGAHTGYESALALIAQNCRCERCTKDTIKERTKDLCLVLTAETILKVGLILSNSDVAAGLRPRRDGFLRLYDMQVEATVSRLNDGICQQRACQRLGPIRWVIEPEREDDELSWGYNVEHRLRSMMRGALGLFTTLREQQDTWKFDSRSGAMSSHGICAYRKILQGLATHDQAGCSLGRVVIIPGRTEWHGIAYDRVYDWFQNTDDEFSLDNGLINTDEMTFEGPANQILTMRMEESPDMLKVVYRLTNSNGRFIHMAPCQMVIFALSARGLVPCQGQGGHHRSCRPLGRTHNLDVWSVNGKRVSCYETPNDFILHAIWAHADFFAENYFVVWTDRCMPGTLQRAIASIETSKIILVVSACHQRVLSSYLRFARSPND